MSPEVKYVRREQVLMLDDWGKIVQVATAFSLVAGGAYKLVQASRRKRFVPREDFADRMDRLEMRVATLTGTVNGRTDEIVERMTRLETDVAYLKERARSRAANTD